MNIELIVNKLSELADRLEQNGMETEAEVIDLCIHEITFGWSEKKVDE